MLVFLAVVGGGLVAMLEAEIVVFWEFVSGWEVYSCWLFCYWSC